MKTGRISGAEALVRWAHPRLGVITPVHFIKLAEQSGIITRVTNWMLNATMGYLRGWQESGHTGKLALNLSAHDIRSPAMAQRIEDQLDAWGVRPELIQFELTESALIEDPDAALAALSRIKACGADVFIDDYGTGYSSLSYLQRFPIDGIKIDQSFISPMLDDPDSAVIVRSTIELGHALGSQVVAEGVENVRVWQQLTEHGCDQAQGYLISMPMPIEELARWQSRGERVVEPGIAAADAHSRCFDPPHLA
ncbi:EAL domain-containing protein [Telluria aromaticivorans]|nr:EAL domain-containing protein [Telluria aromaticivorans]